MSSAATVTTISSPSAAYQFSNREERRVAEFLDRCGLAWDYETIIFGLGDDASFKPDFHLPDVDAFLEVTKGRLNGKVNKRKGMATKYPHVDVFWGRVIGSTIHVYHGYIEDCVESGAYGEFSLSGIQDSLRFLRYLSGNTGKAIARRETIEALYAIGNVPHRELVLVQ